MVPFGCRNLLENLPVVSHACKLEVLHDVRRFIHLIFSHPTAPKCRCGRVRMRSSSCGDLLLLIVGPNGTFLLLTPNNSQEPDDNECKLTVANIDSDAVSKMRRAKGATETEEPFKVLISQSIEFHLKGKKKCSGQQHLSVKRRMNFASAPFK